MNLKKVVPEKEIPVRSKQAIEDLIDLGHYYTTSLEDEWTGQSGVILSQFPTGIHAYYRGAFDVRGLIQLAGETTNKDTGYDYPEAVKEIQVNCVADQFDFLQGAVGIVSDGTIIGEYFLHFEEGDKKSVPIIYGQNVRDIRDNRDNSKLIEADTVEAGNDLRLYKYTVNNPRPESKIVTIDFISKKTKSAPLVVAMTAEVFRTHMEHEWFDTIRIYNVMPPRDEAAVKNQIDLSSYFFASMDDDWFNHAGHDLHDVPKGIQEFDGVKFDVRGLIVLAGGWRTLKITGLALPEEFLGINIGMKGNKLHFLHASAFDSPPGTKIGAYIINYANGEQREIPLKYRENVMDWWERKEEGEVTDPNATPAWYGSNAASRSFGLRTRIIKYTWENPLPEVEMTSLDFKTELENAAPMLFAMTVE